MTNRRTRSFAALSVFGALTWAAGSGCDAGHAPTTSTTSSAAASALSASAPTASATASPLERPDEIKPVYPVDAGPPDPLAQRLCDALHTLPGARSAECCGPGGAAADAIGRECVRTLSYAIAQHAVTVAPADVDRCVEAMTKATAGCDWVVPFGTVAVPPACTGIVHGALGEKATCRSSLECQAGLRCQGLSTIDLGACGPPKAAKSACNLAIDMLASYTRQDRFDRDHPECDGYCGRSRCEPPIAEGGACTADITCGKGRCVGGKCTTAAPPAIGEACTSECAYGARCLKGKCAAPKAEGEACDVNEECRGMCDKTGTAAGHCQKACPTVRLPILKNMPPPIATARRR